LAIPVTVLLGFSCVVALNVGPPGLSYPSVLALGLMMFASVPLGLVFAFPYVLRYANVELQASSDGLVLMRKGRNRRIDWRDVLSIIEIDEVVVITTKSGPTRPLPRRAFQSDTQRRDFLRDALKWHANAAGHTTA
jgi:hypothetical protein